MPASDVNVQKVAIKQSEEVISRNYVNNSAKE